MNLQNWNYSHFNSENFKALISLTAVPDETEGVKYLYSPTVLDNEENEVFQVDFEKVSDAISFMNDKYGHWSFTNPALKSGSGCGSCEAH